MSTPIVSAVSGQAAPTSVYPRRLLRVQTAADAADVSRSTIYRAINAGSLDLVKIGTAAAITADSFERWIARLPRASSETAA